MGGKGGGSGGGTTTVNSNQSPPPQVLQAYQNVVNQAQQVAGQPLQQYTGPMVAGFTPAQMQSMQTIDNSQGVANPYINAAAQYAGQSATPIAPTQFSADQVQQYMNPYTQNVINSTQAQFNNQNQQQAQQQAGQAIAQGAFGGDREQIAQAELANQQQLAQAPVLANLAQQNYSQALGEFNTQQQVGVGAQEATGWLGSNAGYALGNLGNEALNTQLSGANAQLQSGALQQQLAQEELNIPYEMFQQQQGYPFQTTNFLAGITEGIGGMEGGTSSTTSPTASTGSQAAGLGIAGLGALGSSGALSGMFANRGGRVPRDMGGGLTGFDQTDASDVNQALAMAGDSPVPLPNGGNNNYTTMPAAPAPNALAGLGPDPVSSSSGDSGGGWGGALQGGAEGAMIGTEIFPGWGTAIGAGVGALVGGLSNRGGRVGRASGGGNLPNIPDVSISYVPSVASAGGGRGSGLPGAPQQPGGNNGSSSSPLSELQQGMSYGKLFNHAPSGPASSGLTGDGTYSPANLQASESFDAARNSGGIYSFGGGGAGALGDLGSLGGDSSLLADTGEAAAFFNRGGRLHRDGGGASPLISGFTAAPGHPDISIPVLGTGAPAMGQSFDSGTFGGGTVGIGALGAGGAGSGGTAGFAIPTAAIGTNVANAHPAPAGQLDINPTFNWSPPDPNSLSHATFNPPPPPVATPVPGLGTPGLGAPTQIDTNDNRNEGGGAGGDAGGPGGNGGGNGGNGGGNSAGNDGSDGASDGGTGGNGGDGNANRGGAVRFHRDMGGDIMSSGAQSAGQPLYGGNPMASQQYQQLAKLPTEKLMELAQRVPGTTPQGAVIQRAISQRKMNPSASQQPQQAGFAQAPSPYGTFAGAQAQPQMARGGVAGFRRGYADGGDPNDAPGPPTQVQSLTDMSNQDLVSAQNNPNYSPSLVGREMESRGIRSGWGNLVHSIGSGLSNIGSHFRDSAAAGPADAVTPEQAASGAQTTENAARGIGDWFTKPVIPEDPAQSARTAPVRPFQRAEAGSPDEVSPEDFRGKVLRRDDPVDDVKGGDQSPAGTSGFGPVARPVDAPPDARPVAPGDQPVARPVSGFGPADQPTDEQRLAQEAARSKPTPPAGFTPVSSTTPVNGTPQVKPTSPPPRVAGMTPVPWKNPDTGQVAEPAKPVPPSGGAVAAPTADPKTAGMQPAKAAPPAENPSRNWSQSPWLALMNAGAAMAAGNSPHWMQNAAAGIQAGTKTLGEQTKFDQTERFQQAEQDAKNRGYDLQAKKLDDDLKYHQDSLKEEHDWHGQTAAHQALSDQTAAQRAAITDSREQDYRQRILEQGGRPSYVGPSTDVDHPGSVMIGRRPDGTIGTYIDPIQVGTKAGGGNGGVFKTKYDMYMAGHPEEDEPTRQKNALEYAGGRRQMSAVEIHKAASLQSVNESRIAAAGGTPWTKDQIDSRTNELEVGYNRSAGLTAPAQAGAPQYTADKPWKAPDGADEKTIREQFSKLKKGDTYINPADGLPYTKN